MTRSIIVLLTLVSLLNVEMCWSQRFSQAGFYPVKGSTRKIYSMNPGWRFFKGDVKGAESRGFDDSQWEAANLPHGMEVLSDNASGGKNYQGIAWYRKEFSINGTEHHSRVFIYFEGVMGKCEVFVNGNKVVEHFGGYLPFAADITSVIETGSINIVAVKADNSNDNTYPPGIRQNGLDFTYLGGIYRDVYLIQTHPIHVTLPVLSKTVAGGGVFAATLDVDNNNAQLEVRTEVSNKTEETKSVIIRTTLQDSSLISIKEVKQKIELKAGESKQLSERLSVEKVHLWHPDDPYLHFLKTELIVDDVVVDALKTRLGIRLFEMRGPDGLYINKQPYNNKLIGVNRHQDYTYVGNALPNSGQWRDVKILREGGARIIRAAHYPQDPAFYDACDELGMLATTANPGWHFFNFKNPVFEQRMYDDTRNLVRRDRNIASMLMWETALNETPYQPDHAMNKMHQIAHEEFPFPGMFTVTDYQEAEKAGLDIYYHGNDPEINSFVREFGDGGEVDNWTSQNATTRVNMEWGEKALLQQSLIQAERLNEIYSKPKVSLGGAKWCGIDHQRGYHHDPFWGGLLDGTRNPRYLYYLYKSQYDHDYKLPGIETGPMLYIVHELTQISPKDVVIFSNCDEVRLTWLGEEVATIKPSSDSVFSYLPHPPFIFKDVFDFDIIKSKWRSKIHQIEMIAEGYIDGELVIKEIKNYPEKTAGIELSMADEGLGLIADGIDFIPIRATVVDYDGYKKVLASEYIHFLVEGPGEVIGGRFNYANPVKTKFGVATALIRSTMEPGDIRVIAYSDGLTADTITLYSNPSSMDMLYNKQYVETSVKPGKEQEIIIRNESTELPLDIQELHKEIRNLRLELVGKEQDLMELRSQIKK